MRQKETFKTLFLFLAILLSILPVLITFNDVITRVVDRLILYTWLQERVVPLQTRLVGLLMQPLGVSYIAFKDGMVVNGQPMVMTWNCLGWQSLVLFGISLIMGLWGASFSLISKLKTLVLGLIGIFWVNLFRITLTVVLAVYAMPVFRIVFHDYLAAITSVGYLVVFWYFSYAYVLEKREG